jgi:nitrate/nitrite transport system ATP-binding protein
LIEIRGVSKTFRGGASARHVLENVHLTVDAGEFVSVVGYSGSGKSTLLAIVAGLMPPDSGDVKVRGVKQQGYPTGTSIVFQNYSLLPWLSALENVELAVEAGFPGSPREERRARSVRYIEMVGLGKAFEKRPGQLSGGMRQRVAIARAFAIEPEILLLDEPFGALDALTRANLQEELARLCSASGKTVTTIMITNSVQEAILLSDRIVPMTRGPRATLGPSIAVRLPKPRTASMLLHDLDAVRIQNKIVEFLTGFTGSAAPGREPSATTPVVRGVVSAGAEI